MELTAIDITTRTTIHLFVTSIGVERCAIEACTAVTKVEDKETRYPRTVAFCATWFPLELYRVEKPGLRNILRGNQFFILLWALR